MWFYVFFSVRVGQTRRHQQWLQSRTRVTYLSVTDSPGARKHEVEVKKTNGKGYCCHVDTNEFALDGV